MVRHLTKLENPESKTVPRRRIFLAACEPSLGDGLARLVDQCDDLSACGCTEEAEEAFEAIVGSEPDAVLIDLSREDTSTLELIRKLQIHGGPARLVALAMRAESRWAERFTRTDSAGYRMRSEFSDAVIRALREILSGQKPRGHATNAETGVIVVREQADHSAHTPDHLTPREFEIFWRVAQGAGNAAIARELNISPNTVHVHCHHIRIILGLEREAGLRRAAARWIRKQEGRKSGDAAADYLG